MKIIDGKTAIVTWITNPESKVYKKLKVSYKNSISEAKELLVNGRKVSSCYVMAKKQKRVLSEEEMSKMFGEKNIIRRNEKELTRMEKQWMKAWGYKIPSLPRKRKRTSISPQERTFTSSKKRNIFDSDIRIFHMGIQFPNGEKKGEQVVVRHKKQNGIMDVRAMLQNGSRLINCTCETTDGYSQQLTDSEMIALFGKENVITKEARRKAEAQKRWEKHCIKKGWEVRPPADKYL